MKLLMRRDQLIWILTVALFASIYIFYSSSSGSLILAVISILIALESGRDRKSISIYFGKYHLYVLRFALFCFASSLWAWHPQSSISMGITIIEILLCMSLIYPHYYDEGTPEPLLKAVMWAGHLVSLYSLLYYGKDALAAIIGGARVSNAFNNINSIGMLASMAIVINFHYILDRKPKWSDIFLIFSFAIMIATASRKALVMVIIGIFLVYSFKNIGNKQFINTLFRAIVAIGLLAIIIYFLSQMPIFSGINERMRGLLALVSNADATSETPILRVQYIRVGLNQFKQTPIGGIGIGNSGMLVSGFYGRNTYLHNNFVELLACGGLCGFIVYYSIYAYILTRILSLKKYWDKSTAIVLTIVLLQLILDCGYVSYYSKNTYFYFMIAFLYIEFLKARKLSTLKYADGEFNK